MADRQPSLLVQVIAHGLVGLGVALIASRILRKRSALGVALVAMVAHQLLDAPVAAAIAGVVEARSRSI
jgi:hypothetical protein